MARRELQQALKNKLSKKAEKQTVWNGFLGNLDGNVAVPGKPNYVYVTTNDGQVSEVYNKVAPAIANLPVSIGFDPSQENSDLLEVLSIRNLPRFGTTDAAYHTDGHHASHEWMNKDGNTDVVYVHLRQFMPLRPTIVRPYGIYIWPSMMQIAGVWQAVGGSTVDLIDYKPAPHTAVSGSAAAALFVLLSISATSGSVIITAGSTKTVGTLAVADIPAVPTNNTPICAVRLYGFQDFISESRLSTDLIDMRLGIPKLANGVYPVAKNPVANFFLTGYDAVSGSFSSGSMAAASGSATGVHNDLSGLQGGTSNEYYHLTAAEHTIATQASGSGQSGYLSSADWLRFNATSGSAGIPDAPSDGNLYARENAGWVAFTPFTDAPADGKQYARQNNTWAEVTASGSGGSGATDILMVQAFS
ncbi:MAG: hypothetical protein M0R06_08375 [Sphaerochaeta sp.]|jgi:hypothetical protein|nr:hypothetical protein [Sphaerochaeta sp.]